MYQQTIIYIVFETEFYYIAKAELLCVNYFELTILFQGPECWDLQVHTATTGGVFHFYQSKVIIFVEGLSKTLKHQIIKTDVEIILFTPSQALTLLHKIFAFLTNSLYQIILKFNLFLWFELKSKFSRNRNLVFH